MRVELVTLLTEETADHREHRDALDGAAADPIHSRAWWRFSAGIIPIRASMVGPPLWQPRATSSGKVLGFPIRSYAMVGTVRI